MCDTPRRLFDLLRPEAAQASASPTAPGAPAWAPSLAASPLSLPTAGQLQPLPGSRRPRIWELDAHAHCPVVGVCLPIPQLHKLAERLYGARTWSDEYELHCMVVTDCKQRGRVAEAVQKELDRRYQLAIQQAARLKTTEQLVAWWRQLGGGPQLAEAFWATITHPRCTPDLAHRVLGQVHMLQHQVGAAIRVDVAQLDALEARNAVALRERDEALARLHSLSDTQAQRHEALEREVLRLRAELIGRETAVAQWKEAHEALLAAQPGLPDRVSLQRARQQLSERVNAMQKQLHQQTEEARRLGERAAQAEARMEALLQARGDEAATQVAEASRHGHSRAERLAERAVLCVGGRPASVPAYRALIEQTGGRFLHHDGGEEDNPQRLEASLASADLVVCQTGCISHGAYWRVKAHCKRTGKPCVYVDTPGRHALARALETMS